MYLQMYTTWKKIHHHICSIVDCKKKRNEKFIDTPDYYLLEKFADKILFSKKDIEIFTYIQLKVNQLQAIAVSNDPFSNVKTVGE